MKFEEILPEMRKGRRARCEQVHIQKVWLTLEEIGTYQHMGALLSAFIQGDWELEPLPPQKIEVTKKTMKEAYFRTMKQVMLSPGTAPMFEILLKEIGFKDE